MSLKLCILFAKNCNIALGQPELQRFCNAQGTLHRHSWQVLRLTPAGYVGRVVADALLCSGADSGRPHSQSVPSMSVAHYAQLQPIRERQSVHGTCGPSCLTSPLPLAQPSASACPNLCRSMQAPLRSAAWLTCCRRCTEMLLTGNRPVRAIAAPCFVTVCPAHCCARCKRGDYT